MTCSPRRSRVVFTLAFTCSLAAFVSRCATCAHAADPRSPAAPSKTAKPLEQANPTILYAPFTASYVKLKDADEAYNQGAIALGAGQVRQSGGAFTRALALRPVFADANFERGLCSEELKEWQAAVTDFTTVLREKPLLYDAYIERGRAYQKLNNAARARADFAQAKTLRPERREAYILLGQPIPSAGAPVGGPAPAAAPIARVPASIALPALPALPAAFAPFASEFKDATDPDELYATGIDALNANHFERAGAAFTRALALRHDFVDANYCRGLCFEWLKDWKSAIIDFTTFLPSKSKIYFKTYDGHVERARSYYMSGQENKARADVTAAEAINPSKDDAYLIFGDKNPTKK